MKDMLRPRIRAPAGLVLVYILRCRSRTAVTNDLQPPSGSTEDSCTPKGTPKPSQNTPKTTGTTFVSKNGTRTPAGVMWCWGWCWGVCWLDFKVFLAGSGGGLL